MGKQASEKRAKALLRMSILLAFLLSTAMVLLGIGLNDLNLKYSRTSSTALTTCRREIFILSVPNSKHCCDSVVHSLDWVCVASFDKFNGVFASSWAFLLPLLPFVMTICSSYATEYVTSVSSKESHSSRLILYIVIILYRTVSISILSVVGMLVLYCRLLSSSICHSVLILSIRISQYVLYLGGGNLQTHLLRKSSTSSQCWYIDLIKGTRYRFQLCSALSLFSLMTATSIDLHSHP